MTEETTLARRMANALFSVRPLILLIFLAGTVVAGYFMVQLRVDAGFMKQLPLEHEYMQTFMQYEREFGGANRVMVALVAEDGDMFTPEFFEKFEESRLAFLYQEKTDSGETSRFFKLVDRD